ncbi:MAG: polysaccharide deacetylase family protein, partial [bacterium]
MIRKFLVNLFDRVYRNSVCIFLFHEVSEHPSEFNRLYKLNVPPRVFGRQIEIIRDLFNIITPEQLSSGDYPRPAALITFDDGLPGYFENAVPILESLACPSLIFLNMAPVDGKIFWGGLLTYLTTYRRDFQEAVKEKYGDKLPLFALCPRKMVEEYLDKAGKENIFPQAKRFYGKFSTREQLAKANKYVYLGNHLYNHYNALLLSDSELRDAYVTNQAELDKYPGSIPFFSYPFGQPKSCYNKATDSLIFDLGARFIFTAYPSMNFKKNQSVWHRFSLNEAIQTEEEMKYS